MTSWGTEFVVYFRAQLRNGSAFRLLVIHERIHAWGCRYRLYLVKFRLAKDRSKAGFGQRRLQARIV